MHTNQLNDILSEIFPPPSQQIITQRFANIKDETTSAGCNGICESSGGCKSVFYE